MGIALMQLAATLDGSDQMMDYSSSSTVDPAAMAIGTLIYMVVVGAFSIVMLVAMWKLFVKAGRPGWAALVPVYNTIVLLEIVEKPMWWLVLFFIPFVNVIPMIMVYDALAKAFGKDTGFTVLMILLPVIGFPMLAFGSAQYRGRVPGAAMAGAVPTPGYVPPSAPTPGSMPPAPGV